MSDVHGLQDEPQRRLKRRTGARQRGVHVDDSAAAYTLGALEPADQAQIERHCEHCPRCTRLVEAYRWAVGLLPFLAPPATPRPEVKAALLARIADAQGTGVSAAADPPSRSVAIRPTSGSSTSGSSPSSASSHAAEARKRWRPVPFAVRPYMIAPFVVALTLAGVWALDVGAPTGDRPADPQQGTEQDHFENGYGSTGIEVGTGDTEWHPWVRLAISDAPPEATDVEFSPERPTPPSRIGNGLVSVTGVRVDVGQGPLPASPVGLTTSPVMHAGGVPV